MFPVEDKLEEIRCALAANGSVVLTAPPGSGKTTCVPPALLDEPWLAGRKIVMLEPRRLAARNCAAFIASKFGEPLGETVGYQVRLERKISSRTRLEVVTEGLLAQRILADPELADTGLVIFDEFHERSLQCDLAFAMALDVRRALRPDLRLLVMSATLDAGEVAAHLGDAATVRAEGRMFPVQTRYLGEVSMAAAVRKALAETDGDVLCFLPGEGEIRRTMATLSETRPAGGDGCRAEVLPLYGSLPKEEQDRVFACGPRRKVILATSIAETSVTIPGITCVIDSGLMRRSRFSAATGMSALVTLPLTRDRAEQRRGRAGRVAPGCCYRLWTEGEERQRAERMTPEILEADLCSLVLSSAAWGATRPDALPWLTPPADSAWRQAAALLASLGALDDAFRLTAKGEAMARLPMHPRLANMMLGAADAPTAALLAAIIEEGAPRRETDIRRVLDLVRETPNNPYSRRVVALSRKFLPQTRLNAPGGRAGAPPESEGALLALAYPDRVAKNRGNGAFRMVSGRGAALEQSDPLAKSPFLVCCELDGHQGDARLFLAYPIAQSEVESLFAAKMRDVQSCEWDRREERVRCVRRKMLGEVTLAEADERDSQPEATALAMLDGIRAKGVANIPAWTRDSREKRARIAFLARHLDGWPIPDDDAILAALPPFLGGFSRWRDLERLDLHAVLDSIVAAAGHSRQELERLAPARMTVPSGSNLLIHYDGDEPTVEARLQECFGMMQTPSVAGGKVPIVMTLLSPAHRPVQVTKDLAGFWREGYKLVRKDMRGRYPKHYWPEDPFTATASSRTVKRK